MAGIKLSMNDGRNRSCRSTCDRNLCAEKQHVADLRVNGNANGEAP